MAPKTRIVRGKVSIESTAGLAADPFPLAKLLVGRRRVPSQARSLRTRTEILDAALALAIEHGPGAVTMQMVAQRAGVAAGTAYQFYDDRDAILYEIYEAWAAEFWSRLMLVTTATWTVANWRELLHSHSTAISRFYYESRTIWPVVRYVESTKIGRTAMKTLLDANLERRMKGAVEALREEALRARHYRERLDRALRSFARHLYARVWKAWLAYATQRRLRHERMIEAARYATNLEQNLRGMKDSIEGPEAFSEKQIGRAHV